MAPRGLFHERKTALLRTFLHHRAASGSDCTKLCCTKIEDFTVRVGRLTIFEHINIHIHCGQLTALIGPNGAGKSTLLNMIGGLDSLDSGEIVIDGEPMSNMGER